MATYSQTDNAATTITCTLASLASDTNLLAGRESTSFALGSSGYIDAILSGKITTGTTPTSARNIEIWVVPCIDKTPTWPDVFDGTDSNETVTSRNVLFSLAALVQVITIDSTSDRTYTIKPTALAQFFGGVLPSTAVVFVVHNTAVNLNATGGNHVLEFTPVQFTSA